MLPQQTWPSCFPGLIAFPSSVVAESRAATSRKDSGLHFRSSTISRHFVNQVWWCRSTACWCATPLPIACRRWRAPCTPAIPWISWLASWRSGRSTSAFSRQERSRPCTSSTKRLEETCSWLWPRTTPRTGDTWFCSGAISCKSAR
uniref:Uncharacterized protein n=1 Tax=Ixodes ricinus TaxID=34613 RepID=A0A6B0UW01_IXORI